MSDVSNKKILKELRKQRENCLTTIQGNTAPLRYLHVWMGIISMVLTVGLGLIALNVGVQEKADD